MSTYGSRLAEKAHEPGKAMRWLWLSLLLLFVDQASKYLASTMLAHGESVPAGPLQLADRHNTGAAFSFSRGCRRLAAAAFHRTGPGYLDITGVLALAFTTRTELSARPQCDPRRRVGQCRRSLAVRLRRGFLDFHYAQWHWPSFNLADVWIFLGVALFIWRKYDINQAAAAAESPSVFAIACLTSGIGASWALIRRHAFMSQLYVPDARLLPRALLHPNQSGRAHPAGAATRSSAREGDKTPHEHGQPPPGRDRQHGHVEA